MKKYIKKDYYKYILIGVIIAIITLIFNILLNQFTSIDTYKTEQNNDMPIGEILSTTIIEQDLPNISNVNNIQLQLATYDKKITSNILIRIIDDENKILFENIIDGSEVKDNEYQDIEVNLENKNKKRLKFVIQGINGTKGNALTVWTSERSNSYLNLKLNGNNIERVLKFKVNTSMKINKANKTLVIFMSFSLIIIGIIIFRNITNKIENNFLIIYSGIMIFFALINPIGQTPDEYMHFFRSYSISEGKLFGERLDDNYSIGNYLPEQLIDTETVNNGPFCGTDKFINVLEYNKLANEKVTSNTKFYMLNNTLVYPITSYLPQAIGITIARMFNLSIWSIATLGRIGNMLVYGILCFISIKIIKYRYKIILMFVALMPISIYLGTSLSTDSILIGLSLLYIALCINDKKAISKDNVRRKSLYIVGMLMSLSKFTYLPIILLHWINDKNDKKSIKKGLIYDTVCIVITFLWNLFIMITVSNINSNSEIVPIEQLKYILTNPIKYFLCIMYSIYTNFNEYIMQLSTIGWLTHTLKIFVPFTIALIIIYSLSLQCEEYENNLNNQDLLILTFSMIGSIVLIFTALYLTWTPVGSKTVIGVQGRYFIPIIPIIMIIIKDTFKNTYIVMKNSDKVLSLISYGCLLYTIIYMIVYFWTPFR